MANVVALVTKLGRTVYQNEKGKFISRATYMRERRRGSGGRFMTAKAYSESRSLQQISDELNKILGPPVGGGNWVARVKASRERFEDVLAQG